MDWLLENLFWIFLLGTGIASWINNTRKEKGSRDVIVARQENSEEGKFPHEDHESAVKEEIRRKIAERRREIEEVEDAEIEIFDWLEPELEAAPAPPILPLPPDFSREAASRLPEPLQYPDIKEAEPEKPYACPSGDSNAKHSDSLPSGSLSHFRMNAKGLRRAMLLREILGPPVGLSR